MYEFYGWFVLFEQDDGSVESVTAMHIDRLRTILGDLNWHNATADLHHFNGMWYLMVVGSRNRPLKEASDLEMLLGWLATNLPGSHGLLYELSDYMPIPPGPGAYRARVLARGQVQERLDPFLSPLQLVVEPVVEH